MRGPRLYGSFQDFEREELASMNKVGFSLADLEYEASFRPGREDEEKDEDAFELNFQ
jgi:hypothetical protein